MPELEGTYKGDALQLGAYPMLKSVVQTGHSHIRGVITFKDALVYANPQFSCFTLPQNSAKSQLFECYRGGRRVSQFTNGEIAEQSQDLWSKHFSKSAGDIDDGSLFNYEVRSGDTARPIFMSVDLETPLGFASFLANSANQRKIFVPCSFNMSKILKSVSRQQSNDLVCDKDFYEAELPGPLATEYKENCSAVNNVVVAGTGSHATSSVFSA